MTFEYPLINDFIQIYFNSPKSQVICKSFYMTFHIISWSDLGNLNHISLGSYLIKPENNVCIQQCCHPLIGPINHYDVKKIFFLMMYLFLQSLFFFENVHISWVALQVISLTDQCLSNWNYSHGWLEVSPYYQVFMEGRIIPL